MLDPTSVQTTDNVILFPLPDPDTSASPEDFGVLTERGARMLALIRCQEALPGTWPALAVELDRRIAALLGDTHA